MFIYLGKSAQREISRLLGLTLVLIGTMPSGFALLMAVIIGLLSSLFGLSGLEAATDSLGEMAVPMATATIQLLAIVYFVLVLIFCRCWEPWQSNALEFAAAFVRDLLRSAQFLALLPILSALQIATSALPLTTYTSRTRPMRERPQFVDGENPPLKYA